MSQTSSEENLNILVRQVLERRKNLMEAESAFKTALSELRAACTHTSIVEYEYAPGSTFISAYPPFRVCETCGMKEDGWGCGYKLLANREDRKLTEKSRSEHDLSAVMGWDQI